MTNVATSASATAAATGAGTGSKRTGIAQNFDAFLLLLTTQLRNQNPLEPLDTNEFTQQLVQFASVEQQLRSNETLNALLTSAKASSVSTAASFIGMQVTADGATTRLANGRAEWSLNAARAATQATITIRDASGGIVAAQTKALSSGAQTFAWNGRTSTGALAPEGDYTITVAARDASGQSVSVKTEISGLVGSVDLSGDAPVLLVGSARIPLTQVRSVKTPASN
jgi:flagellar basal-body rod modification protein FlgD